MTKLEVENIASRLSLEDEEFNEEAVPPRKETLRRAKGRELIDNINFLPAGNLRKKSTMPLVRKQQRQSTTSIENVLSE